MPEKSHLCPIIVPERISRILVAVSGGADSVALLRMLCSAREGGIYAVHCNFNLRGEESIRDSRFVEQLCKSLDVPLHVFNFNVPEYMARKGVSLEMACRELRYEKFFSLADSLGCERIAIAHHQEDNIETMLLNLFRGTGLRGLCGMKEVDGKLWRPLLNYSKEQILDYLLSIHQPFITDSSNLKSDVKRNFIRNEIIPLIRTRWPALTKSLAETQNHLQADLSLLEGLVPAADTLSYTELKALPEPDFSIRLALRESGIRGASVATSEIVRAVKAGVYPRRWIIEGRDVILDRDGLHIDRNENPESAPPFIEEKIEMSEDLLNHIRSFPDNNVLYSSIPLDEITFRHPRKGDRIAPLGLRGTTLLSDIMKDAGIPLGLRKRLWVAEDRQGKIIWLQGLKRSRHHLLSPEKKICYKIFSIELNNPTLSDVTSINSK